MKLCVIALLGAALFLALATPSTAAPSEKGRFSTQVSKLQLFMEQCKDSVVRAKAGRSNHELKAQVEVHPTVQFNGSLEDLNLDSFLNYLRWLSAQDAMTLFEDVFFVLSDLANIFGEFFYDLSNYFKYTPVDLDDLYDEYYDSYYPDLEEFLYRSEDFWRAWVDDKEHIPQNLAIYLPNIQAYLEAYGLKTVAYFSKVEEFTRIFITPENLTLIHADAEKALAETSVKLQELKALISPPTSEETPAPPKLTVEGFIGFWKFISELNATSIIVGGIETIVQVRGLRHNFEDSLALIFWEANELDLVNEAANITGNLQTALDSRQIQNRLALDTFIYLLYYGGFWDFLDALDVLLTSWINGFNEIPDITLETVEKLQALAHTTAPEFLEQAQVLTQESLDKLSILLQSYFANFKPKN